MKRDGKQILIFDLKLDTNNQFHKLPDQKEQVVLNYFKTNDNIQVKISRDLNSIVFVSPEENFIYFKDTEIQ